MKCKNCGTDFNANFCPNCGIPVQEGLPAQPQVLSNIQQTNPSNQQQPYAPQQQPKKKGKGCLVAALVVAGILVLILVLIVIIGVAFKDTTSSSTVIVSQQSQVISSELPSSVASSISAQGLAEPHAEIVQENIYKYTDSIDVNHVLYVAELKNMSNVPISVSDVSIDLEDASGAILTTTTFVSATPSEVLPGESFYICESLLEAFDQDTDLNDVGSAILHYSVDDSVNFTPPQVTISETSASGNGNDYRVIGRIENTGTEDIENLMLYIPVWSADGKLLTVTIGMVDSLKAGEKKGFDQSVIYIDSAQNTENAAFEIIPRLLW